MLVFIVAENRNLFQKGCDKTLDNVKKPLHGYTDSVAERWAATLRRRDPELQPIFPAINGPRNRFD